VSRSHARALCPSVLPARRPGPARGRPSYSPLNATRWASSHYKGGATRRAPRAPAVHGPSHPSAPLKAAAASSKFRPAASPTEPSSTSPCIHNSFPSRPFLAPAATSPEQGGTAASTGRRRRATPPAPPPLRTPTEIEPPNPSSPPPALGRSRPPVRRNLAGPPPAGARGRHCKVCDFFGVFCVK
jgi:hypothetical protein